MLRDQIFQNDDIKSEDIDIPEWGVKVRVKGMSAYDRDEFEKSISKERDEADGDINGVHNIRAKYVIYCTYDPETNKPLFVKTDEVWLGKKSFAALDRIYSLARELSGMDDSAVDQRVKS